VFDVILHFHVCVFVCVHPCCVFVGSRLYVCVLMFILSLYKSLHAVSPAAKFLVANGCNPRARNSDTKETPQHAAMAADDAKEFLARAGLQCICTYASTCLQARKRRHTHTNTYIGTYIMSQVN
jgi:hypothetical protein